MWTCGERDRGGMVKRERDRGRVVGWWRRGVCFGARALGMEAEVDVLGGEGRWSNIKARERVCARAVFTLQHPSIL
jgi:hypothetical protein